MQSDSENDQDSLNHDFMEKQSSAQVKTEDAGAHIPGF